MARTGIATPSTRRRLIRVATAAASTLLARVFGPTTGAHLNLITCDSNTTFRRSLSEISR